MKNIIEFSKEIINLSDECFMRYALYAQTEHMSEYGEAASTAFCRDYNADLPRLLMQSRTYSAFFSFDTPDLPDGPFYLVGTQPIYRVFGYKLKENEEIPNMQNLMASLAETLKDFPAIKTEKEKVYPINEDEEKLLTYEMLNTASCVLCGKKAETAFIKEQWQKLLNGESITLVNTNNASGKNISEIFKLGSDNIELFCLKLCEDNSGDVVLRIRETQGKNGTHTFVMSDIYEMGFRFDIDAYEIKTFRIAKDGMVRQTNAAEGIIPFNHFVW